MEDEITVTGTRAAVDAPRDGGIAHDDVELKVRPLEIRVQRLPSGQNGHLETSRWQLEVFDLAADRVDLTISESMTADDEQIEVADRRVEAAKNGRAVQVDTGKVRPEGLAQPLRDG